MHLSRRSFLKGSLAAGAVALTPWQQVRGADSKPFGANETIRVAVVGVGSQGSGHVKTYLSKEFQAMNVRLVAVCDADKDHADKVAAAADKAGVKVDSVQDPRKILDRKDVDVVVTATPNHWHSLLSIWAVQAGKDIYTEKPLSHDIFEGRKVVEAAAKTGRIVYVGTQNRSDESLAEAIEVLKSGIVGKIVRARGFCYKERKSITKTTGEQPIPPSVDYDLWCGPAPKDPVRRAKLHYDWHWFWATGNADIGNQGIHQMDICRWAIGATKVTKAMGIGGRFGYEDDAETPNTEVVFLETDTVPIIFETRGLPRSKTDPAMDAYKPGDIRVGEVIECEGGYLAGGFIYDSKGEKVKQFKRDSGSKHRVNWIKCLRDRTPQSNKAPALEGHLSAVCFHVGNISYRVGQEMGQAEAAERFKSDKIAQEVWNRTAAHITANEPEGSKWKPTVGPCLTFDPVAEKFTGELADKANILTKGPVGGKYRAPFTVPDTI